MATAHCSRYLTGHQYFSGKDLPSVKTRSLRFCPSVIRFCGFEYATSVPEEFVKIPLFEILSFTWLSATIESSVNISLSKVGLCEAQAPFFFEWEDIWGFRLLL